MKKYFYLITSFFISSHVRCLSLFSSTAVSETLIQEPNQTLMDLFMLKKTSLNPKTDNYLYKKLTNNVCSYDAQLKLYNSFETNKSSQTILDKQTQKKETYTKLFDLFKYYEDKSSYLLQQGTNFQANQNCLNLSQKIQNIKITQLRDNFFNNLDNSNQFFYQSRKGFICSICDPQNQSYFDFQRKQILYSNEFCHNMVKNTLSISNFEQVYLSEITQLFLKFAQNCDYFGKYQSKRVNKKYILKYNKKVTQSIKNCVKSQGRKNNIEYCTRYCKNFKMFGFSVSLEIVHNNLSLVTERLEDLKQKFSETTSTQVDYNTNEIWVLAEKDQDEQSLGDDIDPDLINAFNEKYDSNLLLPIKYDFASDFKIQEKKQKIIRFFEIDENKNINIHKFEPVFVQDGLETYNMGQVCSTNKETAETILQLIAQQSSVVQSSGIGSSVLSLFK